MKIVDKAAIIGTGAFIAFVISGIEDILKCSRMSKENINTIKTFLDAAVELGLSDDKKLYVLSLVLCKIIAQLTQRLTGSRNMALIAEKLTVFVGSKKGRVKPNDILDAGAFLAGEQFGMWAEKKVAEIVNPNDPRLSYSA